MLVARWVSAEVAVLMRLKSRKEAATGGSLVTIGKEYGYVRYVCYCIVAIEGTPGKQSIWYSYRYRHSS
jgi:hypothetical protein